jgi:adenylate cyclase class 2
MSNIIDDSDVLPLDPLPGRGEDGAVQPLEVEVKFLLRDFDAFRKRLAAKGAELVAPCVFELNVRFDTADGALLARQELLRLRQDTRARLTFKGPSAEDAKSEAKVREEIELEIGDFERMSAVLQRLGFLPVQTYEKYRETYHWRGVEIVLDELPFGKFIELEGEDAELKGVAEALGLDWSRRILGNYLGLMELCRHSFALDFSDLTFDNFSGRAIDMGELLPVCTLLELEG